MEEEEIKKEEEVLFEEEPVKKKRASKKPADTRKKVYSQSFLDHKFVKGHAPTTRPKGSNLKVQIQHLFIDMLQEPIKKNGKEVPFATAYKKEFITNAMNGGWSAKILADRMFSSNILEEIDKSLNKDIMLDLDFQSYRLFKRAHDIQQKILNSNNRKIYCMAGRRAGKTEGNILKALDVAIRKEDAQVLVICLTQETAMKLYWKNITLLLEELGFAGEGNNKLEGLITLNNGSIISLKGNNSITDREKFRGAHWDLVIIDEVQSQRALPYLINDIIEPTLLDSAGTLVLSGTGPRVKGTYWEKLWTDISGALKLNWNLSQNPFIVDYENVLEQVKIDKNLTDDSPLFQREYLGLCVYDSDAQVFRTSDANYYTDDELVSWLNSQPISDIKLTAGLDYGYADCDAFVIVLYSTSRKEKFVIYEYKANRTGVTELYNAIKKGIDFVVSNSMFKFIELSADSSIPSDFYIYCDTNEQKISAEFRNQYNLPTVNAYKYDKNLAIELLQEEVKQGNLKIRRDSQIEDEFFKTIWARNDKDELTRKIDDDNYHPDEVDALIYSLRWIWKYAEKELI